MEELFLQLDNIVRKLEENNNSLEITIKLFKEGNNLVSQCKKRLSEANRNVTSITNKK